MSRVRGSIDLEYFWYVIAALGAGIGTGLAGLSAATVMVPILIVLCPSFAGEAGAYQATAIALASDILGSAVTTAVYWKHKNIDLKRGWIMFVCITSMCIAGSIVAFRVGNVVLGNFSLFLTFCIGIRFLVKPDTQRKNTASKGERLDWKGVAISLFFGLTIGFGTGFVGTGGGMMMLIVFTAFLGMDLKSAVGTSTFIMTFTALIASVSHIIIEPAILTERWDALIICIAVATISSLVSAQFANRVKNRTVGLATGVVLTLLGAAMICLNYWEILSRCTLLVQVAACALEFCEYVFFGAVILIAVYLLFKKIPKHVFRKLLHLLAFSCLVEMTLEAQTWEAAAITSLLFAAVVYPLLCLVEKYDWYGKLFVQKKTGEVKKSLLMLFIMYAVLISLCWGILDKPYIAMAATLMWGVGDAAAALFGKKYGRHPATLPLADHRKTQEGSIAMAVFAFLAGMAGMFFMKDLAWYQCVFYPLIAAPVSSLTELITKNGDDTITVPIATAVVLTIVSFIF